MAKQYWKGSALLAPVPPTLVTCGTMDNTNVFTVAWTGITATHPPMTYISVRKSRYSYDLIKNSGEFAINIPTSEMCRAVDYCGVKSGRDTNKFADCSLQIEPAKNISVPVLTNSPVVLECKVKQVIDCGSHMMFLSDIVGTIVDDKYLDPNGKLDLSKAKIISYSHGEYYELGRKLGTFGFSVRKKQKKSKNNKKKIK